MSNARCSTKSGDLCNRAAAAGLTAKWCEHWTAVGAWAPLAPRQKWRSSLSMAAGSPTMLKICLASLSWYGSLTQERCQTPVAKDKKKNSVTSVLMVTAACWRSDYSRRAR